MKKTILSIVIALITITSFATTTFDSEKIIGEWKGAYIVNANVIPINVYIKNTNGELSASVDYPYRNIDDNTFDITIDGDVFLLKRKNKQGHVMQFEGKQDGPIVTGSFAYIADAMDGNRGIFQLMKSSAKHIKGEPIPSYSLNTFNNTTVDKSSFKGKYVLLDFWATWCGPCVKKRPMLEKIHNKYGDKVEIISISLDREKETVQNFRKSKYPMDWHHAIRPDMKNDPLIKELVPQGLPYGYIIDPNGIILATGDALKAENLESTANRIFQNND